MKSPFILIVFGSFFFAACMPKKEKQEETYKDPTSSLYDQTLKPFYHGVASGDPLQDRVILWTRVTPDDSSATVNVKWEISSTSDFSSISKSDSVSTSIARDFIVKVDAIGLKAGTKYFYRFKALGSTSETGDTK